VLLSDTCPSAPLLTLIMFLCASVACLRVRDVYIILYIPLSRSHLLVLCASDIYISTYIYIYLFLPLPRCSLSSRLACPALAAPVYECLDLSRHTSTLPIPRHSHAFPFAAPLHSRVFHCIVLVLSESLRDPVNPLGLQPRAYHCICILWRHREKIS
jgi:hypothetical protein